MEFFCRPRKRKSFKVCIFGTPHGNVLYVGPLLLKITQKIMEPCQIRPSADADRVIKLHPLVLINISDHYTRASLRSTGSSLQSGGAATGVLFGVQRDDVVDIYESFEMVYDKDGASGVVKFDQEFLQRKKAQCECMCLAPT